MAGFIQLSFPNKTPTMKPALLAYILSTSSLSAGTLILSDNFNAPDNTNFDNSDQTGRRNGLLGSSVQLRSARIQHGISVNQLSLLPHPVAGSGRIRFQEVASLPTNVWTNFAASPASSTILAEGGLRVSFDWTSTDTTSANWVSFSAGINALTAGEPEMRVNHAGTDFGILFRNNGGTQYFKNSISANGSNFSAVLGPKKVVVDLAFTSFADGSIVTAKASVDGTVVTEGQTFNWNGNSGVVHFELGTIAAGTRIDNFAMTGLTGFTQTLAGSTFYSSVPAGTTIGTLSGFANDFPEASTFTLVPGDGDTDNGKFRITNDRLETGTFDFQSVPDGQTFSLRVRGTGNNSGASNEFVYSVSLIADNDSDDLPDFWELDKASDLSSLNGRAAGPGPGAGTGDFDGDGLRDMEEFQFFATYPALSPALADSDNDGLNDRLEFTPDAASGRPATNPVLSDTDADGLNDLVETNTGTFVNAADTGTSAVDYDFDNDLFPDGYELQRGSLVMDSLSTPTLPAPFSVGILTTDETSGLSPANTYTHAFSGGYPSTVNGLELPALTPTVAVPNFTWASRTNLDTAATLNPIAAPTLENWMPDNGNVTGSGLRQLLGGFVYSANADTPRSRQIYTLTNLTPGQPYELRLYNRVWSKGGSGRPVSLTITNGTQISNAYLLQDRPGVMTTTANDDTAYYLAFPYTAQGTELVIEAATPLTTIPISGSMHLYGLTNQAAADNSFSITDIVVQSNPASVTLTFESVPGATYAVDASTAMNTAGQPGGWTQVAGNLTSNGSTTTYTDTVVAGTVTRLFYRVRRLP